MAYTWNWRYQRPWQPGDKETIIRAMELECGHYVRPPSDTGWECRECVLDK